MRKRRNLPPIDYLQECLEYDPATGIAIWKERPRDHFKNLVLKDKWNRTYANRDAGNIHQTGININLIETTFPFSAVCYKLATGIEPTLIGHQNKRRGDNRLYNLINLTTTQEYNAQCLPSSKYEPGSLIKFRRMNLNNEMVYEVISYTKDHTHLFIRRSTEEQASREVDYLKEKLL